MILSTLAGLWMALCVQTQTQLKQGWVKDSYEFNREGKFTHTREWFKDSKCTEIDSAERETGEIRIRQRASGMMVAKNTYEVDFTASGGTDLGAIAVNGSVLKVARGMSGSTMRNTMLSLFEYRKQ